MKRAYVRRLMLLNGEPNALAYPLSVLKHKLAKANMNFRLVKDNAESLWDSFLLNVDYERAKEAGVETVIFDRGGFQYRGRVAALAEGAREAGLKF